MKLNKVLSLERKYIYDYLSNHRKAQSFSIVWKGSIFMMATKKQLLKTKLFDVNLGIFEISASYTLNKSMPTFHIRLWKINADINLYWK